MKIRILSLVCVASAATLLAGCMAIYKNSDSCEQLMRNKLADTSSDTLKIDHTGVGIDGSRVVVEGSIVHVMTASEVAATAPASAAQTAGAVGTAPASATGVAVGVSAVPAASSAAGAVGASPLSFKSAKPQKTTTPAAAECTFHGSTLGAFTWLAPAKLVTPPAQTAQ